MDLSELLGRLVAGGHGVKAASLLGLDGVAVKTVLGEGESLDSDIATWELGMADLLRLTSRAVRGLGWPATDSITLAAGETTLLARRVVTGYYLLLVVDSEANINRADRELFRASILLSES